MSKLKKISDDIVEHNQRVSKMVGMNSEPENASMNRDKVQIIARFKTFLADRTMHNLETTIEPTSAFRPVPMVHVGDELLVTL